MRRTETPVIEMDRSVPANATRTFGRGAGAVTTRAPRSRRSARLALLLGCILAACGSPDLPAVVEAYGVSVPRDAYGERLALFIWPDYLDPELVGEFERTYGVDVSIDYYDTNEAMIAKLGAGGTGQYDVAVASDYAVEVLIQQGLAEPLDKSRIPNVANLDARFMDPPYDPGNVYSIPYQWGTSGIGVRTDLVRDSSRIEPSWALLFDPARSLGPFTMLNDPRETIGAALIYLGFSANSTNPDELAAAERLLMAQRERVLTYAPFATARDLLGSGDATAAHNYSGDVLMVKDEVPAVTYLIPREGSIIWTDNLMIPGQAPNKVLAELFINFILDAGVGARLSNFTMYATPNAAARTLVEPELLADPSIYPEEDVLARLELLRDVGEARALYDRIWTRLRAGATGR
jgi:spermidine/putrescine transport system substrate-binding protein